MQNVSISQFLRIEKIMQSSRYFSWINTTWWKVKLVLLWYEDYYCYIGGDGLFFFHTSVVGLENKITINCTHQYFRNLQYRFLKMHQFTNCDTCVLMQTLARYFSNLHSIFQVVRSSWQLFPNSSCNCVNCRFLLWPYWQLLVKFIRLVFFLNESQWSWLANINKNVLINLSCPFSELTWLLWQCWILNKISF